MGTGGGGEARERAPRCWRLVTTATAALLAACAPVETSSEPKKEPFTVVTVPGSDLSRLTLEPKAAERVGIRTAEVGVRSIPVGLRLPTREVATIPYAALLYGADGNAFVYTNPEPFVFVRHPVVVETIDGDTAVLAVGPPLGMPVVMEGASELAGIEFGVGK